MSAVRPFSGLPARRAWARVDSGAHRQRGVSLGIVAAMLIVVGALTVLGNALYGMRAERAQTVATAERLELVVRGLTDFAILHKRLPCPAPGGDRTGIEARLDGGCDDQSGGVVPWRTLAIADPNARDRWGHAFSYRVADSLTTEASLERVRHRQNQKGDSQGSQKVIQAMSWVKGGQPWMTRPYSEDLRERVVRVVESGTSRNAAAKQFDVSISFVVKLMQRWKQRGTIKADKYGGWKKSKLAPHGDRIRALVMENCDITIDELCVLLAAEGIEAKRSTLGDFLLAQGLSRKKRQPTPPSRSALTSRRREPLGATSNLG